MLEHEQRRTAPHPRPASWAIPPGEPSNKNVALQRLAGPNSIALLSGVKANITKVHHPDLKGGGRSCVMFIAEAVVYVSDLVRAHGRSCVMLIA